MASARSKSSNKAGERKSTEGNVAERKAPNEDKKRDKKKDQKTAARRAPDQKRANRKASDRKAGERKANDRKASDRKKKRKSSRRRKSEGAPLPAPGELHWDHLLRATPDAVVTVRASGRLARWSAAAARLTGRKRWEVGRRGLRSIFENGETYRTILSDLDQRGAIRGRELMLRRSGGESVPVRMFASRLPDSGEVGSSSQSKDVSKKDTSKGNNSPNNNRASKKDPDRERYLFVFHDLTEVQHIKERLIETEKLSAMAKIAGSVAHEFRNPLNSLFISTDLLEDELEADDATRRAIAPTLQAIREEIERLNQIITHYLALSKIGGAEPKVLDLGDTVASFTEELESRAADVGVTMRVRRDDGNHEISVDPNQVRRVLLNVVENALDAIRGTHETVMPAAAHVPTNGKGTEPEPSAAARRGTITLQVRRMRRSVKVTIRDSGPGIPEDVQAKVFEPFFTDKPGGSGLGLYLVREIVHASGGAMTLSSTPGRGTSVSIRWPAVVPHPKMRAKPASKGAK